MELLKNLSKTFHNIFPFVDFLYILQLEEYYTKNYFSSLKRFFFRRNLQKRGILVFTHRIKLTLVVSMILFLFSLFLFLMLTNQLVGIVISSLLIPIWVGTANLIMSPFFQLIRFNVQRKAKAKFEGTNMNTKIIAIAGSFGKTTTKYLLYQFIRFNHKVQIIHGNINTPTGIADWVLKNFDSSTQYLICEMDAYEQGEICASCKVLKPDIAILTNFGDQHLSRFGSSKTLTHALSEVFLCGHEDASVFLTQPVLAKLKKIKITPLKTQKASTVIFSKKITYKNKTIGGVENFSEALRQSLQIALSVAGEFDIPYEFIVDSLRKIELPGGRLKKNTVDGFTVIDDSYNVSFTTAKLGLDYAKKESERAKKKLLVITGGIPELGRENSDANYELGKMLSKNAAYIVALETILINDVKSGLAAENFPYSSTIDASGMTDAWKKIREKFEPKKILVLMQPELTDLYY